MQINQICTANGIAGNFNTQLNTLNFKGSQNLQVEKKSTNQNLELNYCENKQDLVIHTKDTDRIRFLTTDEANKYFLDEYGIESHFDNVNQAHTVKKAIDDFVKLNIDNKGKKIFEGLIINTKALNLRLPACFGILNEDCDIQYNDKEIEEKLNEAYLKKDWDGAKNILKKYPPDNIVYIPVLTINKLRNFDNNFRRNCRPSYHSTNTDKGIIQHELGHMLHMKYSFPEYFTNNGCTKHNNRDIALAKKVSPYATKSKQEFVAEYVAGRLSGKNYNAEVDNLYNQYEGPDIFN